MSFRQVDVSAGWNWYVRGWGLFMKNPGMWLVTALVMMILLAVLSWFPLVGPAAAALVKPALLGGMLYGARELDQGRSFEFTHLFQALQDSKLTGPMIMLGLLPMVVLLVFAVLFGAALFSAVVGMMLAPKTAGLSGAFGAGSFVMLLLLGIPAWIGLFAALFFSIPQVMFGRAEWLDAIKSSLNACLANIVPMLLFVVIFIVLAMLAAVFTFGFGMLLLAPVVVAAMYCAWSEVYGGTPD